MDLNKYYIYIYVQTQKRPQSCRPNSALTKAVEIRLMPVQYSPWKGKNMEKQQSSNKFHPNIDKYQQYRGWHGIPSRPKKMKKPLNHSLVAAPYVVNDQKATMSSQHWNLLSTWIRKWFIKRYKRIFLRWNPNKMYECTRIYAAYSHLLSNS